MPCPATRQQEARAIVRTAAPIASAAALPAQPLAACPLRVASALQVGNDCSIFCAASPPSLSLRGGRRPTWQSRSIRLNRGKAIGEIATAFPRLHPKGTSSRFALRAPRPRWGLAMTNLGALRRRMCAAKIARLHGAQGAPLQTQSVRTILTAACTNCKCLPEIATSASGLLAMTNLKAIAVDDVTLQLVSLQGAH